MADEWKKYVEDSRTVCKYGDKCYQRNPEHHKKFKHPPQTHRNDVNRTKRRFSPYASPHHSPKTIKRNESPSSSGTELMAGKENDNAEKNKDEKKHDEDVDIVNKNEKDDIGDSVDARKEYFDTGKDKDEIKNEDVVKNENDDKGDCVDPKDRNINCTDTSDAQQTVVLPENITFYNKSIDHSIFKELFLVEMPEDFFKFYDFVTDYSGSFKSGLASVNLTPIGPYELLMGKLPKLNDKELYLIHWRFFYDPPEFQAVLKKKNGDSEYHIGYFRDDPEQTPAFVGSNNSANNCCITPMAWNIFGAVYLFLQNESKKSPFSAVACQKLRNGIKAYAEKHNISLEEFNKKKRAPQTVARSLHGAGIVVPYDKKTQIGYRQIETDANLKKLFASLEKATTDKEKEEILSLLQPVITYASIAVDECDFGAGLEVGLALFCSGIKELEPSALSCLAVAYNVLNRTAFSQIIQAHIKHRRRGPHMSVLDMKK